MQKRRVLAKLMAMNANYSKDSDDQGPTNPLPKPVVASTAQVQASAPTPSVPQPPVETFSAPKRSKWEKAVLPTAAQAKPAPPAPTPTPIQDLAQIQLPAAKQKTEDAGLSLDMNCPSDEQDFLKLSEDKSIDVEKPKPQTNQ